MPRAPRTYRLTPEIVASSVGAGVMCLSAVGLGRAYRLYAERPGPELNRRVMRSAWKGNARKPERFDLPSDSLVESAPKPSLIRVDVMGPLEQRAGYHDPCGGWSDGHDAVADRLVAAFAEGDVLLYCEGPGGAAAGIQQNTTRALKAKAANGRRVTGWISEEAASAHAWWLFSICDEIFLPVGGKFGSIGARGGHLSIAGAMAQAGEVMTYFADPPDKVALAPELPLGDVGRARGNRDVKIMADAFRAVVCGSPVGLRYGLTPEALIALGADMLTGQAAVEAGLCDGVASEDEVIAYALKMAERGGKDAGAAQARSNGAQARARGGAMKIRASTAAAPGARAEGDEGEDAAPADEPPPSEPGRDIPSKCGACGVENNVVAKFCIGCGASMATMPEDAEPASAPGAAASAAALPRRTGGSLAEHLGLPADASLPAQKAVVLGLQRVFDHAAKLTGYKSDDEIVGGLNVLSRDAANGVRYRRERNDLRAAQETADRWSLSQRLVACGGALRGKVFLDEVSEDGTRKLDANGKPIVKLTPMYAEMRLGTLRAEVESSERSATPRNPFEPDRAAAEAAATGAKNGDTKARIERAKTHPKVIAMRDRPGNTLTLDAIATSFVDNNFDLQQGAQ